MKWPSRSIVCPLGLTLALASCARRDADRVAPTPSAPSSAPAFIDAAAPSPPPREPWPALRLTRGEARDAGPYAMLEPTLDDSAPCARALPSATPFEMRVSRGTKDGRSLLRVSLKNCSQEPRAVHHQGRSSRVSLEVRAPDAGLVPITDTHADQKFGNTVYCVDVHRFLPGEERRLTDADVTFEDASLVVAVDGLVARLERATPVDVRMSFRSTETSCVDDRGPGARARRIADVWTGSVGASLAIAR